MGGGAHNPCGRSSIYSAPYHLQSCGNVGSVWPDLTVFKKISLESRFCKSFEVWAHHVGQTKRSMSSVYGL